MKFYSSFFLFFYFVNISYGQTDRKSGRQLREGNDTVEQVTLPIPLSFMVSASQLPYSDRNSLTDPFVKVFTYSDENPLQLPVGRSETLKNTQDPQWLTAFRVPVKRGIHQKLIFIIQDHDVWNNDDQVGFAEVDVDEFLRTSPGVANATLTYGPQPFDAPNNGTILIQETKPFAFKLSGMNMPKKDQLPNGLSDPYVKCYFRFGPNGLSHKYYETTVMNNVEEGEWPDRIQFPNYIPGSNQYLHFRVKDEDTFSRDAEMGEAILEVDGFVRKNKPEILILEGRGVEEGGQASLTITPLDLK